VEKWISSEIQESIAVKPGITGLWQVDARRHPPFEKNMGLDLE
jgi:lipopolysaccharide/colanic/teichoic acid biosynthesis glycosyltransferase